MIIPSLQCSSACLLFVLVCMVAGRGRCPSARQCRLGKGRSPGDDPSPTHSAATNGTPERAREAEHHRALERGDREHAHAPSRGWDHGDGGRRGAVCARATPLLVASTGSHSTRPSCALYHSEWCCARVARLMLTRCDGIVCAHGTAPRSRLSLASRRAVRLSTHRRALTPRVVSTNHRYPSRTSR
jgi:hypothetical protein